MEKRFEAYKLSVEESRKKSVFTFIWWRECVRMSESTMILFGIIFVLFISLRSTHLNVHLISVQ